MAQGSMGKKDEGLQFPGALVAALRTASLVSPLATCELLRLAKQAQELFQESYWPRGEAGSQVSAVKLMAAIAWKAQCLHFMADLRLGLLDFCGNMWAFKLKKTADGCHTKALNRET